MSTRRVSFGLRTTVIRGAFAVALLSGFPQYSTPSAAVRAQQQAPLGDSIDAQRGLERTVGSWLTGTPPAKIHPALAQVVLRVLGRGSVLVLEADALVERALRPSEGETLTALLHGATSVQVMRSALDGLELESESDGLREAGLHWLGELGTPEDIQRAILLATPIGLEVKRNAPIPARLRLSFSRAARAMATRNPDRLQFFVNAFDRAPAGLLAGLVEALAEVPSPTGLRSLVRLLQQVPELDPYLLSKIANTAAAIWQTPDADLRGDVRALLLAGDESVRRDAMRAVGALRDAESLPILIDALEAEDPNVVSSAHRALREITGLPFPAQSARWIKWHEEQLDWAQTRSRELLGQLRRGGAAFVVQGLREVSAHQLYRDQVALGITPCLDRAEEDLVAMTCSVLQHLDSSLVVPDLARVLDHDSAKVRSAAEQALRELTGLDLGPDPAPWLVIARER